MIPALVGVAKSSNVVMVSGKTDPKEKDDINARRNILFKFKIN